MSARLVAFGILAVAFLVIAGLLWIERKAERAEKRAERQRDEIARIEIPRTGWEG